MITPTTEQIENSLRWWIALGSGLESRYVQPGDSNSRPAPNVPYASLLLISMSQPGKPVQRRVLDGAGDIVEDTQALIRARYSLQWYRDGAPDMASRFRVWAYSSAGRYAATSGLTSYPLAAGQAGPPESYHGIGGAFAPFAMMRLTDPSLVVTVIADDIELRYAATLDVQYVQTFEDTIQRFVGADIILSDGYSPEVTISVEAP